MAIEDFRNVVKFARDLNIPQQFVSYEHGIPKDMPAGDGDRVIIPFIMGMRGSLTKTEARKGGQCGATPSRAIRKRSSICS